MKRIMRHVLIALCRWVLRRPAPTPDYVRILMMEHDLDVRTHGNSYSKHYLPPGRDRVIYR